VTVRRRYHVRRTAEGRTACLPTERAPSGLLPFGAPSNVLGWISTGRAPLPRKGAGDGRLVDPSRRFVPAYLRSWGALREKIAEAVDALRHRTLCPRNCAVDRLAGAFGVRKVVRRARVSAHSPHFGEEMS
jgi:hypothetical protein